MRPVKQIGYPENTRRRHNVALCQQCIVFAGYFAGCVYLPGVFFVIRSRPDMPVYFVASNNQIAMFQSYAG